MHALNEKAERRSAMGPLDEADFRHLKQSAIRESAHWVLVPQRERCTARRQTSLRSDDGNWAWYMALLQRELLSDLSHLVRGGM